MISPTTHRAGSEPARALAWLGQGGTGPDSAQALAVPFELRRRDTGSLIRAYATEGAALAFVRDVVRIGGREQAACFSLDEQDERGETRRLAEGLALVQRALEDRAK